MSKKKFKSSEVLAVAMSLLMDGGAKTCCSAIGRAVRQLTGDPPEKTKKGKNKESMPKHPLYRQAVKYIELFRPTEREADISSSKRLLKPTEKGQRTWWRTPTHPRIYAHKTERLIALSWAFIDAQKARD
jgi:hypothetical protein